jgi:hypothetical protein
MFFEVYVYLAEGAGCLDAYAVEDAVVVEDGGERFGRCGRREVQEAPDRLPPLSNFFIALRPETYVAKDRLYEYGDNNKERKERDRNRDR